MSLEHLGNKTRAYLQLVEARKTCRDCKDSENPSKDLINPAECEGGSFDCSELGPWSHWQGNLDAEILLVGQDWGQVDWFVRQQGCPRNAGTTNTTLLQLFSAAGIDIELPRETAGRGTLFFTNAVLCMKKGKATDGVRSKWFRNCGKNFLRPLIEIVQPNAVICLGGRAYQSVLRAFNKKPRAIGGAVESGEPVQLDCGIVVFGVFHCGGLGLAQRNLNAQIGDWKRIGEYLSRKRGGL